MTKQEKVYQDLWMLGYWQAHTEDGLYIEIDKDLDKNGIDFQLQKRGDNS